MWHVKMVHSRSHVEYTDTSPSAIIDFELNMGVGDYNNEISVEFLGKLEMPSGTFNVELYNDEGESHSFFGFELGDVGYTVKEGRVISTIARATFASELPTLNQFIDHIENNGVPESYDINLVKAELGAEECYEPRVSSITLSDVLVRHLRQSVANSTEFWKTLEDYGLGIASDGEDLYHLIFINEPERNEQNEPIVFEAEPTGDFKFSYNVHNREGAYLTRRIVGQSITGGASADAFRDGDVEPAINIKNAQVGTFSRRYAILSERDKLRSNSDTYSGVTLPLTPSIRPRHLWRYNGRDYLVKQVGHRFSAGGHYTKMTASLYQFFTQGDSIAIKIDRAPGRAVGNYKVPLAFAPKEILRHGSTDVNDWEVVIKEPTSPFETLKTDGTIVDIKGVPFVGDKLRAVLVAFDCPPQESMQYQWMHLDISFGGGVSLIPIMGATNKEYTVQDSDVGKAMAVQIIYPNSDGDIVVDTPPAQMSRFVRRNTIGQAQLVLCDVDVKLNWLMAIALLAGIVAIGPGIVASRAAWAWLRLARRVFASGRDPKRAYNLLRKIIGRNAATAWRFMVGSLWQAALPLSVYALAAGAITYQSLQISEDDLRKALGANVVLLAIHDPEGAMLMGENVLADIEGAPVYETVEQITWEQSSDNGATWQTITDVDFSAMFHNPVPVIDYANSTQRELVEEGWYLVGALFPGRNMEGTLIRATVAPYYDYLDSKPPVPNQFGNPNPSIITKPVLIPTGAAPIIDGVLSVSEPIGGFQAGDSVTLRVPPVVTQGQLTPALVSVRRFDNSLFRIDDYTFDSGRGQISGVPPVTYTFQAADPNDPTIGDVGKYFEFALEYTIGAYRYTTTPVRTTKPVIA